MKTSNIYAGRTTWVKAYAVWTMIRSVYKNPSILIDRGGEMRLYLARAAAKKGGPVVDVQLVRLEDGTKLSLASLVKASRPLVLNFGSYT